MWNNHRYPHVYVGDCDHVQPLVGAGTRTRSQTGLRFHKPNATVCVIKWIWQIRKRWSLHKTNNIVNINYIHTYRELSYSQNDLITAARARLSLGLARETHTGSVSVALCAKWKSASSQLRCVHTAKYKKSGIQLQITLCRLDHKYLQFPPTHKLSPLVRHLFHTEFLFTIKTPRHTRRCPRFSRVLKFVGSGL